MSEIILPKTSPEVATSIIEEYEANPADFLRRTVVSLEDENPIFLDGSLRGAVYFTILGYQDDVQQILSGSFYRYECTAREVKNQGNKVPFIGEGSIRRSLSEIRMLTEGLRRAGGDMEAAIRQRVMRIERDDPEIGGILRQMLSRDTFIEGAHTTHLNFTFLDQRESEQILPLSEPAQPSVLPVVRRSIIRSALLEIILDPQRFASGVFDQAYKFIPELVDRLIRTVDSMGNYSNIYALFASFTINSIMQELSHRAEILPPILEEDPPIHPDPVINKAMKEDPEEANRLLREYNLSILAEIKNTNLHLAWGIGALSEPVSKMTGPEVTVALNGVVNPYSSLKVGMSKYMA